MRPRALVLLTLSLTVIATPVAADLGGFVIESFHTDLEVLADSDVLVEERIEVRFLEPRRGLYRTIPVRYTDPKGYSYSLGFRLIDVRDADGTPHKVKVSNEGRYINVRMGDANRTVTGVVVYRLRYRIERALGHFPEYDELYWNAVGHEFQAQIKQATASVRLPAPFTLADLRVAGYQGPFGSGGQEVEIDLPEAGVVWFAATRALAPLEGLTVAVGWPKGAVTAPGPLDEILRFFAANWILLAPFLAFAWLWRRYRRHGRDPVGRGSVVVRYEPPEGVSAGEIGTVIDERVDLRDITATLVDLAVRGYLRISIEENQVLFGLFDAEEILFTRLAEGDASDLLPHERAVLDGVFTSADTVELSDLKEKFYRQIPGIRDALQERMVTAGYFKGKANQIRQRFALLGLPAGALVFLLGLGWLKMRGGAMSHAVIVPLVAGILTAALFLAFAPAMPGRTRKGVDLRGWALGFQEFVERVETDRLEADRQRGVFESMLPYAMALGVAATWARRFEGIYAERAPSWFVGRAGLQGLSTQSLESNLSSAMSKTGQAMASAPRSSGSSGSGGGGFSGGGGGGGGGGSW